MKQLPSLLFVIILALFTYPSAIDAADAESSVAIVLPEKATQPEQAAARELAHFLGKLYPKNQFQVIRQPTSAAKSIYIGTPRSIPEILEHLGGKKLQGPESFLVTKATINRRPAGMIVGDDPAGVVYGVYGLLRKLGCGFYLSFDALPGAKDGHFDFNEWDLADRPLAFDRIVFNWHNFLSGCSAWNYEQWRDWITQSQKAGYNAVMVHAYGNNPMAGFEFNGLQKPVGYLSSTRVGRDWSTMHVNDVRRLWGGEVFDRPVFGSTASVDGDDRTRTAAARKLMSKVFQHAENRGVKVYFAVDVDTVSANPQPLIESLPLSARFPVNTKAMRGNDLRRPKIWLANPDTPEGYAFYKAQVQDWLEHYPGMDCLVAWFRHGPTPWTTMKLDELPAEWQKQYAAEIENTPAARDLHRSHNLFAIARIVAAYRKALKELGREDVQTAIGSWYNTFFPAADRFMPPGVKFLPLDQTVLRGTSYLETPETRTELKAVGGHRPIALIPWAHHDDGHYLGRPYIPTKKVATKLKEARCEGFGIIHWTTRPLDIYFDSMARQTRQSTRDEPIEKTCRDMALRCFGTEAAATMAQYLQKWLTEAPKFSRETTDYYFDPKHEVADPGELLLKMQKRLALLDAVDTSKFTKAQRARIGYYKGLERYIVDAHRAETLYRQAQKALSDGREEEARRLMAQCRPEAVIQQFAEFSQLGGINRGDQGTIVSMNTRWLPHILRLRQQLGLEPIRINFGHTSHDPLAQLPGPYTFHFGPRRELWQTLGEQETGASTFTLPKDVKITPADDSTKNPSLDSWTDIARTGIQSDKPITILLRPILRGHSTVPPGDYRLTLLFVVLNSTGEERSAFEVAISLDGGKGKKVLDRMDLAKRTGGRNRLLTLNYPITLKKRDTIKVAISPVEGKALVCGALLTPVGNN